MNRRLLFILYIGLFLYSPVIAQDKDCEHGVQLPIMSGTGRTHSFTLSHVVVRVLAYQKNANAGNHANVGMVVNSEKSLEMICE